MTSNDRTDLARACYAAYETGDRQALENLVADDFTFWSPQDEGIDRSTYFDRCWPNSKTLAAFSFKRLVEVGDEVLVTYEAERKDGSRFRNTEILNFAGNRLAHVEVYFGWNL